MSQWTKSLCLSDIKWLFFFLVGKIYIIIIDDTISKVGKLSIRNLGLGASKWIALTGCSGWHGGHCVHDPPGAVELCAFIRRGADWKTGVCPLLGAARDEM